MSLVVSIENLNIETVGTTRHGSLVQLSAGTHTGEIYDIPDDIWERLDYSDFEASDPDEAGNV